MQVLHVAFASASLLAALVAGYATVKDRDSKNAREVSAPTGLKVRGETYLPGPPPEKRDEAGAPSPDDYWPPSIKKRYDDPDIYWPPVTGPNEYWVSDKANEANTEED